MSELIELTVSVDAETAEAVSELFERAGGGAVVELRPDPDAEILVRTYIDASDADALGRLETGLWHLGQLADIPEATVRRLAERDWSEAWKEHFHPLRIGRHFLVVPTWRDPPTMPADRVLRLDPGMAFGTGLHPTTRLCLEAIEDLAGPGVSLLDVGTGSGILAIGAAMVGTGPVAACDTDPRAAETARANAVLNRVEVAVHPGGMDAVPPGTYDLVVANILARVIRDLAPALAQRVAPGGHLIAAGILEDQADDVEAALEAAGLQPEARAQLADWVAVTAARSRGAEGAS